MNRIAYIVEKIDQWLKVQEESRENNRREMLHEMADYDYAVCETLRRVLSIIETSEISSDDGYRQWI